MYVSIRFCYLATIIDINGMDKIIETPLQCNTVQHHHKLNPQHDHIVESTPFKKVYTKTEHYNLTEGRIYWRTVVLGC